MTIFLAVVTALMVIVTPLVSVRNAEAQEPGFAVEYATLIGGAGTDDCDAIAMDGAGAAYLGCHSSSMDLPGLGPLRGDMDAFVFKVTPDGQAVAYVAQIGGTEWEAVQDIAVDATGHVYAVGASYSPDLATTSGGAQPQPGGGEGDAFVARLGPDGAIIYLTYIGGSGMDDATGVVLDAEGNAYVVGRTASADFPVSDGALQTSLRGGVDAFVTKLDPSGKILYSTYLGGAEDDAAWAVGLDSGGRLHVGGATESDDFPLVNARQTGHAGQEDGFVAVLNRAGSGLDFATFLGGSGQDEITSLTVDRAGRVYVAGLTGSSDLVVTDQAWQPSFGGGGRDAFLVELAPLGSSVVRLSYLGGSGNESRVRVASGADGDVFIAGGTDSQDFPTVLPLQADLRGGSDGYLALLRNGELQFSTYFGGGTSDVFEAAAAHPEGGLVVTGMSGSTDFPMRAGLGYAYAGGRGDIPVVRLGMTTGPGPATRGDLAPGG